MKPFTHKEIAKQIAIDYRDGHCKRVERATVGGHCVEFCIDGLTLRCRDDVQSVQALCNKYLKALKAWQRPAPLPSRRRVRM